MATNEERTTAFDALEKMSGIHYEWEEF